jgi:membrane fusion protein, macrolide-specific efflux system
MAEPRRRPWYLYLLAGIVVVLAVLAVAEIGPPTSSARTSTQIVTAEKGVVQSTVTGSGNVEAGTDLDVNFQTSGSLSNVYVHVGQHVDKGKLLATLNSSSAQLTLDQADQNLTAAQDQLTSADSGSSTSSSSTSTTSSAQSIASAQAAVDSAQASVNSAQTALNATKLYAPISGTIASLAGLSPGDSVSSGSTGSASTSATSSTTSSSGSSGSSSGTTAGSTGGSGTSTSSSSSGSTSTPFVEIVNTSKMTMTVAFSESDVGKLKVGQTATVTPDALSGVELSAHVTGISPVGTTSSDVVSYNATLTLNQKDSSLKPGMSASAAVIVSQVQGVNVPNAAVSGTGSLASVTVLRNGKETQQQVAVGLRGDSRTQIVSGLSAGEQVVIKTTLPPLTSATTSTTGGSSGTLGGSATGTRPGGFGGAAGGAAGAAGAAGGRTAGAAGFGGGAG